MSDKTDAFNVAIFNSTLTSTFYLGIDPGHSGGAALLNNFGAITAVFKFADLTDHDIYRLLNIWKSNCLTIVAMIERVHSMPKQGVSSTFKFGRSYGFLIGLLTALQIPFEYVTPQKWQKELCCLTHGDKNISKAAAQRRWPEQKITHAIADALLIAEFARRTTI